MQKSKKLKASTKPKEEKKDSVARVGDFPLRVIVVAGNRREFEYYVRGHRDNGISTDIVDFIYGEPQRIRGILADGVVLTGTFFKRKEKEDLLRLAYSRVKPYK